MFLKASKLTHCVVLLKCLRLTDWKYREWLARFGKSKTLKLSLKNTFRELLSKILFRFSKNLKSSRNSQKTKILLFASLDMHTGKLTRVLGIRIESFYKTTTRDKLSMRASPFSYLTIGSFQFFKHSKGSVNCGRIFKRL